MLPAIRFVVEAVLNEAYVVDERLNLLTPLHELKSARSVDEADDCAEESTYTKPAEFVLRIPDVEVDSVRFPANRFVVEAVKNELYIVLDE